MELFDFLQSLDPGAIPGQTKVHLAVWNGREDPLDKFIDGDFEEWQRWQTKRNFQRDIVVSLIALPGRSRWLFAGCFDSENVKWKQRQELYHYDLVKRSATDELTGRLVVKFERTGRQSYLRAENWLEEMTVSEIFAKKMTVPGFPGFQRICLTKSQLDRIIINDVASWKSALSSVGGVYLIADLVTGKGYVGSASGDSGFWARWSSYSATGHGGNKELKRLLKDQGGEYASNFQFSILETADNRSAPEDILGRESHWKSVLLSRAPFGYNAN
jgi:hypothetical protein